MNGGTDMDAAVTPEQELQARAGACLSLYDVDVRVDPEGSIGFEYQGVLCSLRAVNHWMRCERAMRRGEDLPASRFPALLSVVVALVAVAMVAVVLLGWAG